MKNKFAKTAALSIITALTVTGGVYSPLYAAMTKESVKLYKSAQKFEAQNRFKDAIDLMEKALATSPNLRGFIRKRVNMTKPLKYTRKPSG